MGGNGVIAVDYKQLDNAKSNLQKAKSRNSDALRSIKSAQLKLEIDIDSSRIRAVEDNLEGYYRKLNTIQTSIDTAINKIDKIEKTTREVDKRCADRIRGIGTEGSGNKQGGILGGIEGLISDVEKEFDDHPIIGDIGMAIIDGAVIIGTAAAVIIGGPEILGVGLVVGTVFAANSLINEGVKIYNNVTSGKNTGYDVMEEGFEKVLGKQAGEEAYELANIAAIAVAAPEMIASAASLLKNGVNLLKDGAAAANDFIKGNKIGEEIENGFKEITENEKVEMGSNEINNISEIEKEAEEPSPFDELIGYIEYGDKGKEILAEENVKEIELEDKILNQIEKGDIESLYKESGIEDIANANPVAGGGVEAIEDGGELIEEAPEVIGGVGNEINIAKEELGELSGEIKDDFKGGSNAEKLSMNQIDELIEEIGGSIKNHPLRQEYENAVKNLCNYEAELRAQGLSQKDIAETLYKARRNLGVKYKNLTSDALREYIYEVNMERYGDELGASFDFLVNKYSSQCENMDEVYETIIKSSQRPNGNVDKLLQNFKEWLIKKNQ